jgi:flagellar protein FlaG
MDIGSINTASVHNESPKLQVAEMSETDVKTMESTAAMNRERAESISREEALAVAESLEEYMEILKTSIGFSINESTNRIVVTVTNKDTNEIIRQIPTEEMLALQEKMKELTGIIFSKSV